MHRGQNHLLIGTSFTSGMRHPMCQPQEHSSQINMVAVPKDCPHNIYCRLVGTKVKNGSIGHPHWENDMVHNCTHGPSNNIQHFGLLTITFLKVEPSFTHVK
jgi:hypothetical protein